MFPVVGPRRLLLCRAIDEAIEFDVEVLRFLTFAPARRDHIANRIKDATIFRRTLDHPGASIRITQDFLFALYALATWITSQSVLLPSGYVRPEQGTMHDPYNAAIADGIAIARNLHLEIEEFFTSGFLGIETGNPELS
jgi:hypothetical protein